MHTVLITGATDGLGLALARRYLEDREPERVAVPADEFDAWFEDGAGHAR